MVPRSYVTNLRNDRIESPDYEKMSAIARTMAFPPELCSRRKWVPAEGWTGSCRSKEHIALDEELLEALVDETAEAILRESASLPERSELSSG